VPPSITGAVYGGLTHTNTTLEVRGTASTNVVETDAATMDEANAGAAVKPDDLSVLIDPLF
jgi:hypothetical protein